MTTPLDADVELSTKGSTPPGYDPTTGGPLDEPAPAAAPAPAPAPEAPPAPAPA